jgi:protein-disulfide isomerase
VQGRDDAPITLIEYGDFECIYCGIAHAVVKAVQRELGGMVRFVFRHFPLTETHPNARLAAQVSEAAAAQHRFWEMHDMLLRHQHALSQEDLRRYASKVGLDAARVVRELVAGTHAGRVKDDFRSGVRSGVNETPTFFVNGARFDGSWTDVDSFIGALRDAAWRPAGAETA